MAGACGEDPSSQMEPEQEDIADPTTGMDSETDGDETGDLASIGGANVCAQAEPIGAGVHRGELANRDSSKGGPCGAGGPDVFWALEPTVRSDIFVSARADAFSPRIGIFGADCAADWDSTELLCAPGVGGWVTDVAAGTPLWVSVGWETDPTSDAMSLPFELDVTYRKVLDDGALCQPSTLGRCASGTVCRELEDDDGNLVAAARCEAVEGDRCAEALPIQVFRGETQLVIARGAAHTDAHEHSCAGARTRERVYRLELPETSAGDLLEIEAPDVDALALRDPTCLVDHEVACVSNPQSRPLRAEVSAAREIYLFVELPRTAEEDEGEEPPYSVRIRLVEPT